jgi:Family of unknown function (DUF6340)
MKLIRLVFLPAFYLLLTSCMSSTCFIGPTIPPEKQLPEEIKSLVIINRTYEPTTLFGIFKTKSFGKHDKPGVPECINAMGAEFANAKSYRILTDMKGLIAQQSIYFPEPISSSDVKFICSDYGVDAIVAVEVFDVLPEINFVIGMKYVTDSLGRKHEIRNVTAVENVTVTVGWRVYNSKNDSITDQYKSQNHFKWEAEGLSNSEATSKLPALDYALRNIAADMGRNYVKRFSSKVLTVCRSYYGKENAELKKAKSFVKANNWDAAKEIWLAQSTSTDSKTAGRAFANLAVYYERQKDINKTYEMILKSDQLYKNYITTYYINDLQKMYILNK